jgi:cold shock protein
MGRGSQAARVTGTVKRLVTEKSFGFIRTGDGTEYFFHSSACDDFHQLREGDAVSFELGRSPKGPRAEDVRVAS